MTSLKASSILVISSRQDLCESVQQHLRAAGHAVKGVWVKDSKALEKHLSGHAPDVVLYDEEGPSQLQQIVSLREQYCPRTPLLLKDSKLTPAEAAAVLVRGVQAVVTNEHLDYLCQVLLRELEHAEQLRARQTAEEQLVKLARRHRSLMEDSSEAVAYLQEGIHLRCNRQYARVFGYKEAEEVAGLPLMDLVAKSDRETMRSRLKRCEKGKGNTKAEGFNALTRGGKTVALSIKLTRLEGEDDAPQIEVVIPHEAPPTSFAPNARLAGGIHAGRHALFAALRSLAEHGVGSGVCAFLFLSVDKAAAMEDRMGFLAADQISDEVAAFVLDRISDSDRAFRFSPYEIAVLLFRPNMQAAAAMAEGLQGAIANRSYGDASTSTSLTVSAVLRPLTAAENPDEVIRECRKTVRRLQAGEGGGLVLDDKNQDTRQSKNDQLWVNRVREALENNSFRLVFQKIISLEGDEQDFLDAFVRMVGEKGEEILAGSFIPIAERHGLMPMIDQWVIKRAAAAARQRSKQGKPTVVLVRLSESTVVAEDVLLPWLKKFLELHGKEMPQLTFTVKEESLIHNYAKASNLIKELRKLQCRCAVSNFGGSSRCMSLIKDVDLDFVKLQGSLTRQLAAGEDDPKIIRIIRQVTERNIKIVAEQVEDATAMATLWQMGIHYVQGEQIETA